MDAGGIGRARVDLGKLALAALDRDPYFRAWRDGSLRGHLPLFYYYRRSFSTLHDATVTEHGDGFSLSFIDPRDAEDTDEIVYVTVTLPDGSHVLVGGDRSVLSGSFTVGRSKTKSTFKPSRA